MGHFERCVREQNEAFHSKKLPKGHELRFLEKLEAKKSKKTIFQLRYFRVATVVLLLVGGITLLRVWKNDSPQLANAKLPEELQQAENYYLAKCNEQLNYYQVHHSSNSPVDIAEQLGTLEKEYARLKQEMVKQPGNKRVMYALVQNLQLRLQLLEQINRLMENEEPPIVEI